ncbi:AhpC/TSA family protein [Melghirimyces profundicolus]|uniref:AhpC/TSA family protein n=1 Tax=Melghirimyces profundicolus TaxID=1242148 RepID=A0A2T6C8T0_9BACL|nr:AhpC/TSA family protein [Melghirimyces profundicolus]
MKKFQNKQVDPIVISTDDPEALRKMAKDHQFSFPVFHDPEYKASEAYGVYIHRENDPYEDHGTHADPAHILIDDQGRLMYKHKQTGPFGRPSPVELLKTVTYIQKNLKD